MSADPEPRAREGGGVRERILAAALAILRERGIQELSQVRVARRAQVRQSHLTYYFPRRHDLLEAVSARFIGGVVGGLRRAGQAAGGDREALLRGVADAIGELEHMRMFAGVIVEADGDPELRALLVRRTSELQSALAEALGGEDAAERARLVLAAMWGLGLYGFVMRPPAGSEAWAALLDCVAGSPGGARGSRKRG